MTAPCVVDGSMNGKTFLAYVEQSLAPTLKRNDMVIMDKLLARKVPGATSGPSHVPRSHKRAVVAVVLTAPSG